MDRADTAQKEHALELGPALRTLQAIVDSLLDGAPPELAIELREELPDPLKGATKPYDAEAPANVAELLERFRGRAGLPPDDVLHEAQVAAAVIEQMLLGETWRDLRASLPDAFAILFDRPARPGR